MNRPTYICAVFALALAVGCSSGKGCSCEGDKKASGDVQREEPNDMKAPDDFASITDEEKRSRAIFEEMGKVLQHPRCVNCHPSGDEPLQGEKSLPHQPMVTRGNAGMGTPGMRCTTCHGASNFRNSPGSSGWRLAPRQLGWEDKSLAQICETLKLGGGGENLRPVVSFMKNNSVVAYGWTPPDQYEPVPGTHERFGKLAEAWLETGAHCPTTTEGP